MEVNSRVSVLDAPLHGNQKNIVNGSVVSLSGSSALVLIDHEDFPRSFPLAEVQSSEDVYGAELTNHFENVVDATRR